MFWTCWSHCGAASLQLVGTGWALFQMLCISQSVHPCTCSETPPVGLFPPSLSLCLSLNNTPVLSHRAMAITRWSPTSGRNWTPCWKSLASWTRKTQTVSASELCCGPRTRASRRTCGRYGWRAEPCLRQSSTRQQMKCRKRRERRGIKLGHGISHGGNWRK